MSRDSCVFYRSFYEALIELPPEIRAEVYDAIFEYSLNFNEVELIGISKTVFRLIKPQLDANIKKYTTGIENGKKGAEYGQRGGRPKTETLKKPPNNPQITPKKPSNVNDNVNENVNDNDNVNVNALRSNFEEYSKFMLGEIQLEQIAMSLGYNKNETLLCIQEFLELNFAEISELSNKFKVKQFFVNWVQKGDRKQTSINNQMRKKKCITK